MPTPVTLSETAARRLKAIGAREGHPVMLGRAAAEAGGCSGFSYKFDSVNDADADDPKVERRRRGGAGGRRLSGAAERL